MEENLEISEKERERRRKISEYRKKVIEEKRRKGYAAYVRRMRKEKAKKKRAEQREKERIKKEKERKKHTRRVGRPRKPGPKKKRKRIVKKVVKRVASNKKPPFRYKIISCRNGLQNKFVGKYRGIEEAYEEINRLKNADKQVIFQAMITGQDRMEAAVDEYILIEKNEDTESILRNEYGKLVEQKTNIEGWKVIDKFRYKKEETFWVWGYNPKNERKTFQWIYDNIIIQGLGLYAIKRILIYKNKIVVRNDDDTLDIIFCKDTSDAIRFYNLLEQWIKRDKIKQIYLIGSFNALSPTRRKLEDEIIELTGWTRKRVQMNTNTYYIK